MAVMVVASAILLCITRAATVYENVSASLFISRVFAATLISRQKLQDKSQQKLAQCDNTFIKLHVPGRRNKGNKATQIKWQRRLSGCYVLSIQ